MECPEVEGRAGGRLDRVLAVQRTNENGGIPCWLLASREIALSEMEIPFHDHLIITCISRQKFFKMGSEF